jgi:hypothetical protein
MDERDAPNLKIRFVQPVDAAVLAILALFLIYPALRFVQILLPAPLPWMLQAILGLLAAGTLAGSGFILVPIVRHFGTALVLDPEGVWFQTRRGRKGLAWADVVGYETQGGSSGPGLRVLGRQGANLTLPRALGVGLRKREGEVIQALDRRLGPDTIRPREARPLRELDQRVLDHYGRPPAVELEPGLRYRYAERQRLSREFRERLVINTVPMGASLASGLYCTLQLSAFRTAFLLIWLGLTVLIVSYLIPRFRLLRHLGDRFVRRGDVLFVVRDGKEEPLPPPDPKPSGYLFGQPLTRYGRGLFAYRMAPQLLEPDV